MQVLVVEDSAVYCKLICDELKSWGFSPIVAKNGEDAWRKLEQPSSPRLVLLDWVLPDIDGPTLCQRIRQAGSPHDYVYVILLTGKEGRQNMLDAMHAGADDYLMKPFDNLELKARLMAGKRILNLQKELVDAREAMRHAATHDSLTEVMNRAGVLVALNRELERGRREEKPVGIILADVDHFKDVNDTLGHQCGDEALKEIACRLRSKMRIYDFLGRYGGEEFLVVIPGCNLEQLVGRANQLRECVASTPIVLSGLGRVVTVSMGVSIAKKGELNAERLLGQADECLYVAKENGRNRVECQSIVRIKNRSRSVSTNESRASIGR
jgi:two-component system cell cycle response regulator